MSPSRDVQRVRGIMAPVVPTAAASVRLRPLDLRAVGVASGLWAERRKTSREVSIPYALAQLEEVGNLSNLRLAAGLGEGPYRGGTDDSGQPFPFLDTDVYKWLEAVGMGARPRLRTRTLRRDRGPRPSTRSPAAQRDRTATSTAFVPGVGAGPRVQRPPVGPRAVLRRPPRPGRRRAGSEAPGDDRLLRRGRAAPSSASTRSSDHPATRRLIDGHPEIEMALVELYRITGDSRSPGRSPVTLIERRVARGLLGASEVRGAATGRTVRRCARPRRPCPATRSARCTSTRAPSTSPSRRATRSCSRAVVRTLGGDGARDAHVPHRRPRLPPSRRGIRRRPSSCRSDRAYAETCAAIGECHARLAAAARDG